MFVLCFEKTTLIKCSPTGRKNGIHSEELREDTSSITKCSYLMDCLYILEIKLHKNKAEQKKGFNFVKIVKTNPKKI